MAQVRGSGAPGVGLRADGAEGPGGAEDRDPVESDAGSAVDGRTARARRTHEAIVDACIELVGENDVRPTAPRVAERAGVSVRSVFQHFDDLEQLYAAVAHRSIERVARLVVAIDVDLPLDERIAALVGQRAALLEAITPVRRAASVYAPFSPEVRRRMREGHQLLGVQVREVFAPELDVLVEADRAQVTDALEVALAWSNWELLRTFQDRSTERAADVVTRQVRSVLAVAAADPVRPS